MKQFTTFLLVGILTFLAMSYQPKITITIGMIAFVYLIIFAILRAAKDH